MPIAYTEFDRFEFEDCQGVTRSLRGCSLTGRFEFFERIEQIKKRLEQASGDLSWQEFYDQDSRLRFLIERALELNNIKLDWVNLEMVEQLLFYRHNEEGEAIEGWLISLNKPKQAAKTGSKGSTLEEAIAALSLCTNSLSEAFELVDNPEVPADQLLDVMAARADFQDPDKQKKSDQSDLMDELQSDLKNGTLFAPKKTSMKSALAGAMGKG